LKSIDIAKDRVKVNVKQNPFDIDLEEKKNILKEAEKEVKDKKIASTSFSYADSFTRTIYLSSEGSEIETEITRVIALAKVFAKENNKLQVAFERIGGVGGLELIQEFNVKALEAKDRAIRLLSAKSPPIGKFRVVLDPKLTGVFFHEALGHATEADHVLNNESILKNKIGKRIASPIVTVYDDPTIKNSFGFYFYDDEGVKARKKAIVEKGRLVNYLHSRETSEALNMQANGNARAQSFEHVPIPRMSNTYIAKGDFSFDEIIEDIGYGVYLLGSKGGEVDTARGVFQFSAEEGFIIRKGEIVEPIRDVALSGSTLEILKQIDAVGKDFSLHIGFCGKEGQLVPVGDGGAHIRTFATVGGINGY
ncbi:MAG: TldD/PmbA family protein, partial [Candidatus Hydrothermarchaeota archaeon]